MGGTLVKQWLYRDGLKPVAELDGAGNVISTFVYGSRSHVPDLMYRNNALYRIVSDHLGSPQMVVNIANSSDVPYRATYSTFGEASLTGTSDIVPFGFAGGTYDVDTKLVRFGARDYDPSVGRWLSRDPISLKVMGPTSTSMLEMTR